MPPALPSLSLHITPPGLSRADYTQYLAYAGTSSQMTITQHFGRQGDTATIPLVDDYQGQAGPNVIIEVLSQIQLYDNVAGKTLFAGVVTQPTLVVTGPTRNEWILKCVDYTFYADNTIVHGTYNGLSIDLIVVAVTLQANCGISARTPPGGGFVAPGPVLTQVNLPYQTLASAWRSLAQLASISTPYGWYVDENLKLHFFDATTAISAGAAFTTSPTASGMGSLTEAHQALDSQFGYVWDGTSIRNKILVQGASQVVTPNLDGDPTDQWLGNGTQTSWPLRYTVTGSPQLYVNGVSTQVQIQQGFSQQVSGWSIQQNKYGGWFLSNPSPPPTGYVIQIWYSYQVPVIAQASDVASQNQYFGPNGGIYEEYISDSSLSTTSMALARAQREKTEYAFAAERITFNTTEEFFGWIRAGETFTVTNSLIPDSRTGYVGRLVGATFLCISNTVTFGRGGYRTMSIMGVRL